MGRRLPKTRRRRGSGGSTRASAGRPDMLYSHRTNWQKRVMVPDEGAEVAVSNPRWRALRRETRARGYGLPSSVWSSASPPGGGAAPLPGIPSRRRGKTRPRPGVSRLSAVDRGQGERRARMTHSSSYLPGTRRPALSHRPARSAKMGSSSGWGTASLPSPWTPMAGAGRIAVVVVIRRLTPIGPAGLPPGVGVA